MMAKTYPVRRKCNGCGHWQYYMMTVFHNKGQTIEQRLKEMECELCEDK